MLALRIDEHRAIEDDGGGCAGKRRCGAVGQMGGEREQSAAEDKRVEELILDSLRRIENKVDEGFGKQGDRITALEITSGQHTLQLAQMEGASGRLVPWLMLGWNVLMTIIGIVWAVAHLAH